MQPWWTEQTSFKNIILSIPNFWTIVYVNKNNDINMLYDEQNMLQLKTLKLSKLCFLVKTNFQSSIYCALETVPEFTAELLFVFHLGRKKTGLLEEELFL